MKSISLIAAAVLSLSGAATLAQTQYPSTTQTPAEPQAQMPAATTTTTTPDATTTTTTPAATTTTTTPSASTSTTTSSSTQAPAPVVSESKVDLTTEPGPPADMRAAREEAKNALAWAKSEGCRSDPSPRDCVRKAQQDYNTTMARLGSSHASASGTTSASGTNRAGRGDRN
ncbi:MAG TPA: hypothetical protein VF169_25375 [Albitalea sp.]|uniref:hypothetical protein n=1 Tax=Piscinibacter sp. TaxID=1903157 RepID=UPI002ED36AD0